MNVDYYTIGTLFEVQGDWIRSCSVCGATVHANAAPRHTEWHQEQGR